MRNKYICDLCKGEIMERTWEHAPSNFSVVSYCASQNPLGQLGYGFQQAEVLIKECCQKCQHELAKTIMAKLKELSPAIPRVVE